MALTALVFLLIFLGGCLLAFVWHPICGLVTYVAVFYLHPPSRWWGEALPDLRWSLLVAIVTLIAVFVRGTRPPAVPFFSQGVPLGLAVFTSWVVFQSAWALDADMHAVLVETLLKYFILLYLIYRCVDSIAHLKAFLFAHVIGCFYMGWLTFEYYLSGRFEGIGGPDIGEANAFALQMATGILIGSSLILGFSLKLRVALIGMMPFIVNALVTTVSRSGFLAAAVGGLAFTILTPRRFRWAVRICAVLGLLMFLALTNPFYWSRISTITEAGNKSIDVEVPADATGGGRLPLMVAQLQMFREYPMGCGHRCTATLSPDYLDEVFLTGWGDNKARASHNTFLTTLVEQGVPGAVLYLVMVLWCMRTLFRLKREAHSFDPFVAAVLPGVAGAIAAVIIGDLFVDYLKIEVRLWMLGTLLALVRLTAQQGVVETARGLPVPRPA